MSSPGRASHVPVSTLKHAEVASGGDGRAREDDDDEFGSSDVLTDVDAVFDINGELDGKLDDTPDADAATLDETDSGDAAALACDVLGANAPLPTAACRVVCTRDKNGLTCDEERECVLLSSNNASRPKQTSAAGTAMRNESKSLFSAPRIGCIILDSATTPRIAKYKRSFATVTFGTQCHEVSVL